MMYVISTLWRSDDGYHLESPVPWFCWLSRFELCVSNRHCVNSLTTEEISIWCGSDRQDDIFVCAPYKSFNCICTLCATFEFSIFRTTRKSKHAGAMQYFWGLALSRDCTPGMPFNCGRRISDVSYDGKTLMPRYAESSDAQPNSAVSVGQNSRFHHMYICHKISLWRPFALGAELN